MSELTRIALSIFVYAFLAFVYLVVAVAAISETRRWLRNRREAEPVQPSPLIEEIQSWLAARDRTFARQQITPLMGHPRIGIDPIKRRRGV